MRKKDPDKQQRIKDAMVRLILREGIDGTSISKIAREAEVSPATIYVYYTSKEEMLTEVFRECAEEPFRYLMTRIHEQMSGEELIRSIVHGYYRFTTEHEEVFSFVEQCSHCPTLSEHVCERDSSCDLLDLIHLYQNRGEMRTFSDWSLGAVLFAPVRFLAMNRGSIAGEEAELEELVSMLQTLLLY